MKSIGALIFIFPHLDTLPFLEKNKVKAIHVILI